MLLRFAARNNAVKSAARFYSEGQHTTTSSKSGGTSSSTRSSVGINADVPGLSSACVHPASQPVGPGVEPNKSGAYKVPEYFCYDATTFFEAEVEMAKYRCPQPSALKK